MLKNIDPVISPELLKILSEMGHGDEIVFGDGNFPAASMGKRVVRLDGHDMPRILEAVLKLIPLDSYADYQVRLMEVAAGDSYVPEIWQEYRRIIEKYEPAAKIKEVERMAFYEQAKQAYAVVSTGESALYANVILKKGVI